MGSMVYRSQYNFASVSDFGAAMGDGRPQCAQLHPEGQPQPMPAGFLRPINHFLTLIGTPQRPT
eukprot:5036052-Pyramimonas_sp.AAC.2